MKKHIYIIFILFSFVSFSQIVDEPIRTASDERVPLGKLIIKSNFRLPNITSNIFLKENTNGIADIALSGNYNLYKRLYVGAGYRYSNFQISDKKLRSNPKEQLNSDIHLHGLYGELSYIFRLGDLFSLETSFQGGQNNIFISSNPCSSAGISGIKKNGLFYSPNVVIYLRGEENLSFNLSLGYTITNNDFTPEDVCLESFKDYSSEHYEGNYQYFNVGFGIAYSFQK